MARLKQLFQGFILSLILSNTGFADDTATKNIETIKLTDQIYMLMGQGGNIGVSIGDDGVFLIDDQYAPLNPKIKAAIAKLSDKPIRFMINTHWHFDHTGGNENLGHDGVIIVAHNNVRERMSKAGFIAAFNKKIPASPKAALPIITFNDEITFHLNNDVIKVAHQSHAHTDGDSIIFFQKSNVIHMGDTFFNGLYPFIDASSEGKINGMIRTAKHILNLADDHTQIIPGHGPLGNKHALQQFHGMLVSVRDNMKILIAQGKSIEEIVKLKPNAKLDKVWGNGFLNPEAFLKIVHATMPKQ
ncbi:MAG: MBL fold metallo-hydrolase [Methylococcales bacterium]|jgi:cyclase|nr:MBL fold metallo-hydrolase [Methylococcales bacterium]MBT7444819.1 MBL fold metallo-hydrolase [Methylococcales bacterium]